MARTLLLTALVLSAWLPAQQDAAATPTGFLSETVQIGTTDYPYVLYVPRNYTPEQRWPLILFLHGAGECGNDGMLQVAVGLGPAIMKATTEWPFLVLMPQKPNRGSAWEDHDEALMAMLKKTQHDFAVDDRQLFLTGLSQGGHGTWVLGAKHQDLWAAIAPVCGYANGKEIAPALTQMPIWCFHGDADKAVPVQQSKDLTAAVQQAGGHAELTIYPGVGHNSWEKAYGEAGLADWLLAAGAERIVRGYLAKPGSLADCSIELHDLWHPEEGEVPTGAREWHLERKGGRLEWRDELFDPDSLLGRSAPQKRQGSLEADELFRENLQRMLDGGTFRSRSINPPGNRTRRHSVTLHIEINGDGGPFRFHREWSAPAFDWQGPKIGPAEAFAFCISELK
jgi:predicted esterase